MDVFVSTTRTGVSHRCFLLATAFSALSRNRYLISLWQWQLTECFSTHTYCWVWTYWLLSPPPHIIPCQQEEVKLDPTPLYPPKESGMFRWKLYWCLLSLQKVWDLWISSMDHSGSYSQGAKQWAPRQSCLNPDSAPEKAHISGSTLEGIKSPHLVGSPRSSLVFPWGHQGCFAQIKPGFINSIQLVYYSSSSRFPITRASI